MPIPHSLQHQNKQLLDRLPHTMSERRGVLFKRLAAFQSFSVGVDEF
jgi:hypothetical protein